jgi:hypothetical protein
MYRQSKADDVHRGKQRNRCQRVDSVSLLDLQ